MIYQILLIYLYLIEHIWIRNAYKTQPPSLKQRKPKQRTAESSKANNICVMGNIVARHTWNRDASSRGDVRHPSMCQTDCPIAKWMARVRRVRRSIRRDGAKSTRQWYGLIERLNYIPTHLRSTRKYYNRDRDLSQPCLLETPQRDSRMKAPHNYQNTYNYHFNCGWK